VRISAANKGYLHSGEALHACNCIGPQDGNPVCPCAMRSVSIKDGRYVQITDLGPAPVKGDGIDLAWMFGEGVRNGHD